MDDLRVVHGISGGRYGCDKAVQIVRAADLVEVAIRQQLVGHEHHVHRLTGGKQIDDRVIDRLMLGLVEIGDVNGLRDLADGILTHQHAAEHGHFRVVIMRGTRSKIGSPAAADVCVPPRPARSPRSPRSRPPPNPF